MYFELRVKNHKQYKYSERAITIFIVKLLEIEGNFHNNSKIPPYWFLVWVLGLRFFKLMYNNSNTHLFEQIKKR